MEAHFLDNMMPGDGPEFNPIPRYIPQGDCIVHKLANEAVVADRVDEFLTFYRSANDRRVIGYQIKGVLAIIRKFGFDGLEIACDTEGDEVRTVSVAALLLVCFGEGPNTVDRRQAYARTFQDAAAAAIPENELVAA